jgi:hypothetical protein
MHNKKQQSGVSGRENIISMVQISVNSIDLAAEVFTVQYGFQNIIQRQTNELIF